MCRHRGEVGEHDAVGVLGLKERGDGQGDRRFADAPRPGDRHQAGIADPLDDAIHVGVAADGHVPQPRHRWAETARVGAHVGDHLVATGMDRLDDPLSLPVVADRPPSGLDPGRERRFRHEPVAPHRVEQFLLRHDSVTIDDQVVKQAEDLGLDVDGPVGASECEPLVVQLEVPELEAHRAIVAQRGATRPGQGERISRQSPRGLQASAVVVAAQFGP